MPGSGDFDLGLERAGHECIGQVEIDPFCRRVLRARFASVEQQTDVRVAAFNDGGSGIDLLVGGFPCQDLSIAGKRAGLAGERSGLFWEIVRIAKIVRPAWGLFENVPGLLSSRRGADMWTVLTGLRECWPVVGFRILDSRYFGVPQRRRRVFFVCGPSEAGVRKVLFEPEGGTGHPAASGEAGAGITHAVGGSSVSSGYRYDPNGEDFVVSGINGSGLRGRQPGSAASLVGTLREHTRPGSNTDHSIVHSLSAEGADASEDGTGRGTPIVAASDSTRHSSSTAKDGGAFPIQDVRGQRDKRQNGIGIGADGDPMFTLDAVSRHAVGVRRLTPLECERLQGFPDGWTCLCGTEDHELGCKCPDSPRYRALGNAVTVNVIQWLGGKLQ